MHNAIDALYSTLTESIDEINNSTAKISSVSEETLDRIKETTHLTFEQLESMENMSKGTQELTINSSKLAEMTKFYKIN